MRVTEFDTFYPDHLNLKNEDDWEIYARKLKNIMLTAMPDKKNSESGFRDLKEYKKLILCEKSNSKDDKNKTK